MLLADFVLLLTLESESCSSAEGSIYIHLPIKLSEERLFSGKLSATMPIAKRVYSLAQDQNDAALVLGAYNILGFTHHFLGDIGTARQYAKLGVKIWRFGSVEVQEGELESHAVTCLCL